MLLATAGIKGLQGNLHIQLGDCLAFLPQVAEQFY